MDLMSFYKGRKVLVTGHTGFKGSWLCEILAMLGADTVGYSLEPPTNPSLFRLAEIEDETTSINGDVRDRDRLKNVFEQYEPEIVFHLAAQPIVRVGYRNPALTFETNVMGTVNVLECVRNSQSVCSFLNVTTDKVYRNREWEYGYRENEELCGADPYSNSKSCSELVTYSYKKSFFSDGRVAVSTARAGNVIGGGDFAEDRIIPDCVRAAEKNEDIIVRNPCSVRPYQYVLEPLFAYLLIAAKQYEDSSYAGSYNIGPDEGDCVETGELVDMFISKQGNGMKRTIVSDGAFHEDNFLKLDNSRMKKTFGWRPVWNLDTAIDKVVEWSRLYICGASAAELRDCMDKQIKKFIADRSV